MPQKGRLSVEEKVKAVEECINGKDSVRGCGKRHGISNNLNPLVKRGFRNFAFIYLYLAD